MTEKLKNILNGKQKQLFKWLAILCVIGGVGYGGLVGYHAYQSQHEPMIAIKCTHPETEAEQFYFINKIRNSSLPLFLYLPAYQTEKITTDTSADEFVFMDSYRETFEFSEPEKKKVSI